MSCGVLGEQEDEEGGSGWIVLISDLQWCFQECGLENWA